MDVLISPRKLSGEISAISSKSVAHRALICAALADNSTDIIINDINDDITATIEVIKSLGGKVEKNQNTYTVFPIKEVLDDVKEINCFESGSTFRFILPVISAKGFSANINGEGRLPDRPINELGCLLCENGTKIEFKKQGKTLPLFIEGKLKSGRYEISGEVSSQYISGLLFALALLNGDSEIIIKGTLESKGYVDITIQMLDVFGVAVKTTEKGFFVKGNQTYKTPKTLTIEGDYSNAAFWLCGFSLSGGGDVLNLNEHSKQPDKKIYDIIKLYQDNKQNDDISFCAKDIPDLVPVLSVYACGFNVKTTITDCKRLRLKESDRIKTTVEMITALSGEAQINGDSIVIYGKGKLSGGVVDSHNDHRIAMSAAIASVIATGDITINDATAVNKSYPKFFEDFEKLGGIVTWVR